MDKVKEMPAVQSLNTLSGSGKEKSVNPVDFVWDQLVLLLAAITVSIGIVDAIITFFRESNIHCTTKSGELTEDQVAYANGYCYDFLSWKAKSEILVIFLVIQSTLVAGTHFVWSVIVEEDIRFFFRSVYQLDRTRNPKTGKFKEHNIEILKQLQSTYEGRHWFSVTYAFKFLLQISIYVTIVIFFTSESFFNSGEYDLYTFVCPEGFNTTQSMWALSVTVTCYHTSLSTLVIVRWANVVISCIGIIALVYGFFWLIILKQSDKVGYFEMIRFAMETGLHPDHYIYFRQHVLALIGLVWWDDLKFLTLRLFLESAGDGLLLRKMIVQMEMSSESVAKYYDKDCDGDSLRNTLSELWVKLYPLQNKKPSVLGVMFGSTALAHILQRSICQKASRGQFISFDFYLSEDSDPIRERIAPGQDVLLLPAAEKALRCWKDKVSLMESFENFIVIGPLLNDLQCDIVDSLLKQLQEQHSGVGEMLVLTISPLEVGGRNVEKFFTQYRRCQKLKRKDLSENKTPKSFERQEDGSYWVTTKSAGVTCKFVFAIYEWAALTVSTV